MTNVGAGQVKELRERTGAGMMDCKKALQVSGGDLNRAVDFLRKEGLVKAAKKAGRATLEGLIAVEMAADGKRAGVVEVNCETDFVARTDEFRAFVADAGRSVTESGATTVDELSKVRVGKGTVGEALGELIAKLGENMAIRRVGFVHAGPNEILGHYLHAGSKIGVVIRLRGTASSAAREIAMHVAAMNPHYIGREQVPTPVIEREREIIRAQADVADKPAHLLDRIVDGKLSRFFAESCLLEQPFMRDPTGKKSVGVFLAEAASGAEILEVVRFQVGEATA